LRRFHFTDAALDDAGAEGIDLDVEMVEPADPGDRADKPRHLVGEMVLAEQHLLRRGHPLAEQVPAGP
jgi:hypothetical protein